MKLRLFPALAAIALLAGCDSDPAPAHTGLPPSDPGHILLLKRPPAQAFTELGTVRDVEVYYPPGAKSKDLDLGETVDIRVKIRERAAALGADAVIIKDEGLIDPLDPSTGSTHIWVRGVAIRYVRKGDVAAPQTPAPPGP